ncbi:MAG: thiamine phosphate synthase [Bacteroidota bacterium]
MNPADLLLYLVTDPRMTLGRDLIDVVEAAVKGGVSMVQLREKEATTRDFLAQAQRLKKVLAPYQVPLLINDRLDIALAVDAEGVHVGQSDMPVELAREMLGPDKIIGLSVENLAQATAANSLDIDYIGLSPVFSTQTKANIAPPLGLEGVEAIKKVSRFPSVGIGGINLQNAASIIQAGADGVAVVSYLMLADDPETSARLICNRMRLVQPQ